MAVKIIRWVNLSEWKRIWEIEDAVKNIKMVIKRAITVWKITADLRKLFNLSFLSSKSGIKEDNDWPIPISDSSTTNIIKDKRAEK